MKQQGASWTTAAGEKTLAKYLPAHERLFEKLGQSIAKDAEALENKLRELKYDFISACEQALRNSPDKNITKRFSFYTFDREYKIEYDIPEKYVRIYRATKKNPSSKDYTQVLMDFSRILYVGSQQPTEEDIKWANEQLNKYEGKPNDLTADEVGLLPYHNMQPDGPTDDTEENQDPTKGPGDPVLFPKTETGRMEFES